MSLFNILFSGYNVKQKKDNSFEIIIKKTKHRHLSYFKKITGIYNKEFQCLGIDYVTTENEKGSCTFHKCQNKTTLQGNGFAADRILAAFSLWKVRKYVKNHFKMEIVPSKVYSVDIDYLISPQNEHLKQNCN